MFFFASLLISSPTVDRQQSASMTQMESSPQLQVLKFPPPKRASQNQIADTPKRTRGTGSRGHCNPVQESISGISLTAVMPEDNIGTRVSPNPTVYLYVPKSSKKNAEFACAT